MSSQGEIQTETVSMVVEDEEKPKMIEIPGAKMKILKQELEMKIAEKRAELWKQRQEEGLILPEKNDGALKNV